MAYSRVVVVGSTAFDHIMDLPGKISDFIIPEQMDKLNVSFTVETLRKEFGGTGGNCAYALGLLEMKPILISSWGKDAEAYEEHLKAVEVHTDMVKCNPDMFSAWGHVMTDERKNQLWMFYPGALKDLIEYSLADRLEDDDFVALLPSQPQAFSRHLHQVVERGVDFLFDPAFFVANLTVEDLELGIERAKIVIANEYEVELMEHRVKQPLQHWLSEDKIVIKTLAERGSVIYTGSEVIDIPAAKPRELFEPTGAGDAYRAGFLTGFIKGLPLPVCGRMGAVAAVYVVEKDGTQSYGYTPEEFSQRYEENFGEKLTF